MLIVGAGPGGLTAGMLLAHAGHKVTILEKNATVGGRNARLSLGEYHFDTGPTFLLMRFVLDQVFAATGRKATDYLEFTRLDPMYQLIFGQKKINIYDDTGKMQAEIDQHFPNNPGSVERFMTAEKRRFDNLLPVLEEKCDGLTDIFSERFFRALPYMYTPRSLYEQLGQYFKDDELRLCFTFQAKYLGMSPWDCPGAFTMIPYAEHAFGIEHVTGGLNAISTAMAKAITEDHGEIRLNTPVSEIVVKNGVANGVRLDSGQIITADEVIINADFGYAASQLFKPNTLPKYGKEKLEQKKL